MSDILQLSIVCLNLVPEYSVWQSVEILSNHHTEVHAFWLKILPKTIKPLSLLNVRMAGKDFVLAPCRRTQCL